MNKWVNRKLEKKRTTGKGFTLIELIVVVTVLGILAAIVIYAVGNISGAATKSASGTTKSEVNQAEQAYCQANGTYGNLQQLVSTGYLTDPNPDLQVYTYTVPTNAQLFAGCGTSVYDAYPQTLTQPDGTAANIPTPPTTIVTTDGPNAIEMLAALGITPVGGVGVTGASPLINTTNISAMGGGAYSADYQAMAAAKPQLIVGLNGMGDPASIVSSLEAIAPLLAMDGTIATGGFTTPTNPQALDISLLWWVPELIALANVTNTQVQAAAFITAFENASASVEQTLAGKTVSVVSPTSSGLTFEGITSNNNGLPELLEYLGMSVVCPNNACADQNSGDYNLPIANVSTSTVTAQYLFAGIYSSGLTTAEGLLGTPGATQVGPALASAQGGTLASLLPATTMIFGPNVYWQLGAGSAGLTPVTPNLAAASGSPLSGYCSIAGVGYPLAVPNAPTTLNGLQQTDPVVCAPWSASTNSTTGVTTYTSPTGTQSTTPPPQYSALTAPVTAPQLLTGIGMSAPGPVSMMAALPYVASAF